MCTLTDCYQGEAGQQIYLAGLLTIFVCIGCYVGIWVQMRRKLLQGKGGREMDGLARQVL